MTATAGRKATPQTSEEPDEEIRREAASLLHQARSRLDLANDAARQILELALGEGAALADAAHRATERPQVESRRYVVQLHTTALSELVDDTRLLLMEPIMPDEAPGAGE